MTASNSTTVSGGVSVFGLLGVLFIGLKLAHVIDWSWWWVLLPFYWVFAVFMIVLLVYLVALVVAGITIFILDLWNGKPMYKRRRR